MTVTVLPSEIEKRIEEKFGPVVGCWFEFLLARAKYIAVARLNGLSDQDIAREIGVDYNDGGAHVSRIRQSLDIS